MLLHGITARESFEVSLVIFLKSSRLVSRHTLLNPLSNPFVWCSPAIRSTSASLCPARKCNDIHYDSTDDMVKKLCIVPSRSRRTTIAVHSQRSRGKHVRNAGRIQLGDTGEHIHIMHTTFTRVVLLQTAL